MELGSLCLHRECTYPLSHLSYPLILSVKEHWLVFYLQECDNFSGKMSTLFWSINADFLSPSQLLRRWFIVKKNLKTNIKQPFLLLGCLFLPWFEGFCLVLLYAVFSFLVVVSWRPLCWREIGVGERGVGIISEGMERGEIAVRIYWIREESIFNLKYVWYQYDYKIKMVKLYLISNMN